MLPTILSKLNYNETMTQKDDWIAYQRRFRAVAEIELQELRSTSMETKWRQLNSIISLAIRMDIFKQDPSEELVYQTWAKLKEKADRQS
jgi:hypothetical protein